MITKFVKTVRLVRKLRSLAESPSELYLFVKKESVLVEEVVTDIAPEELTPWLMTFLELIKLNEITEEDFKSLLNVLDSVYLRQKSEGEENEAFEANGDDDTVYIEDNTSDNVRGFTRAWRDNFDDR